MISGRCINHLLLRSFLIGKGGATIRSCARCSSLPEHRQQIQCSGDQANGRRVWCLHFDIQGPTLHIQKALTLQQAGLVFPVSFEEGETPKTLADKIVIINGRSPKSQGSVRVHLRAKSVNVCKHLTPAEAFGGPRMQPAGRSE